MGDKVELASCRIDLDLLVIFSCVAHTPRWPVAGALEQREKNFKASHTHTHAHTHRLHTALTCCTFALHFN